MTDEFRLAASDALQETTKQLVSDALKDFRQIKTESDLSMENKRDLISAGRSAETKEARDGRNKAVGSWESRMPPQLDKIKNLGGKLKEAPKPEALPQELSDSPMHKNSNLLQ